MFGIGDHKGVNLPQLISDRTEHLETEDLTVNGTKPHPVQPFNQNIKIMLPHITQKSQRPIPQPPHKPANLEQRSISEAIEIYRKSREDGGNVNFQSVPCPTPIEQGLFYNEEKMVEYINQQELPSREEKREFVNKIEIERKKSVPKPTRQLKPVSTSLQKRLERLAKHKSNAMNIKRQSKKPIPEIDGKMTIKNGSSILPTVQGDSTIKHLHYSFSTTMLPRIQKHPRNASISYQLLEIPAKLAKPDKKRIMFSHSDYDMFQHTKFSAAADKKLSIVAGPETRPLDAVWDYNKFLYLNVKI